MKIINKILIILAFLTCFSNAGENMIFTYSIPVEGLEVAIPFNGIVDVTVDWGDGSAIENFKIPGFAKHKYAALAETKDFDVTISGALTVLGINEENPGALNLNRVKDFGNLGIISLDYAFYGVREIYVLPKDIPVGVTTMERMFKGVSVYGDSIAFWDVSKVVNMAGMFEGSVYNHSPIGSWDVSKVKDMSDMFSTATYFNADLSTWDVSSVTNMKNMFLGNMAFDSDISGWDVSNVSDMSNMFSEAISFNSDISGWNVSNVTDMNHMFYGAYEFNSNIGLWDVSNVTDMSYMFYFCRSLVQDLSNWNVSSVTDMSYMFSKAYNFSSDMDLWDVSKVTNMSHMFAEDYDFNGTLSSWDVSSVIDMGYMFSHTYSFSQDISSWNISNVKNLVFMFNHSYQFNSSLASWGVSHITDMSGMFNHAYMFNSSLESWNVSNVTKMDSMFNNTYNFNQNLGDWDVSNVTNMSGMFKESLMPAARYSELLIGWSKLNLKKDVILDANLLRYTTVAEPARAKIIADFNWTINDDGLAIEQTLSGINSETEIDEVSYGYVDSIDLSNAKSSSKSTEIELISLDTNVIKVIGNKLYAVGIGQSKIYAYEDGNYTYNSITQLVKAIDVKKKELIVTVLDVSKEQGAANPEFEITYSGFVAGEDESFLITTPTANTSSTIDSDAGIYDIIVSGGVSDNYSFKYVNGKLFVGGEVFVLNNFNTSQVRYQLTPSLIHLNINDENYGSYSYQIIRVNGVKLMKSNVNSANIEIQITNLESGVYLMQVFNDANIIENIHFVK